MKYLIYTSILLSITCMVAINANLPAYADNIGIGTEITGWIVSINPLLSLIFSVPFGHMSDKYGRFRVILLGLFFYLLAGIVLVFFKGVTPFLIVKAFEGLALAAYLPAVVALLTDISKKEHLSRSIGSFTSVFNMGFVLAPVAAALIGNFGGLQSIFIFVLVCSIANLFLCIPLYKSLKKGLVRQVSFPDVNIGETLQNIKSFKWPVIIALSLLSFAFGYAMSVFDSIWAYYIHDRGGDIFFINLTYFCYALPVVFLSRYMGSLADKYQNHHVPILLGSLVISIAVFSYGFIPFPLLIAIVCAFEGAGNAAMFPSANAALVKATAEQYKGRVLGIFNSARMGGNFIGAIIAGYLYAVTHVLPFVSGAILILVLSVVAGVAVMKTDLK